MNPYSMFLNHLAGGRPTTAAVAALRLLLPYWAAEWTASPASYVNAFSVVRAKVASLERSQLQEWMLKFVSGFAHHTPGAFTAE